MDQKEELANEFDVEVIEVEASAGRCAGCFACCGAIEPSSSEE